MAGPHNPEKCKCAGCAKKRESASQAILGVLKDMPDAANIAAIAENTRNNRGIIAENSRDDLQLDSPLLTPLESFWDSLPDDFEIDVERRQDGGAYAFLGTVTADRSTKSQIMERYGGGCFRLSAAGQDAPKEFRIEGPPKPTAQFLPVLPPQPVPSQDMQRIEAQLSATNQALQFLANVIAKQASAPPTLPASNPLGDLPSVLGIVEKVMNLVPRAENPGTIISSIVEALKNGISIGERSTGKAPSDAEPPSVWSIIAPSLAKSLEKPLEEAAAQLPQIIAAMRMAPANVKPSDLVPQSAESEFEDIGEASLESGVPAGPPPVGAFPIPSPGNGNLQAAIAGFLAQLPDDDQKTMLEIATRNAAAFGGVVQ